MDEFMASVEDRASEYGADVSALAVGLAIEAYKGLRHYPASYDDDAILADLQGSINKIAMAAVEIDSRDGVEGQNQHTENGITRGYAEKILAYQDVIGYASII